jgi:hypothetical protein
VYAFEGEAQRKKFSFSEHLLQPQDTGPEPVCREAETINETLFLECFASQTLWQSNMKTHRLRKGRKVYGGGSMFQVEQKGPE